MSVLKPGGLYAFTVLVHLAVVAVAYAQLRRQRPVAAVEHIPFAEALQAAQTISPAFDAEIQAAHVHEHEAAAAEPGASLGAQREQ